MKKMMAVCDTDPVFTERFVRYIGEKESTPFRAEAFTDTSCLRERLKEQRAELLLLGEDVEMDEFFSCPEGTVIYLGEERQGSKSPHVYKYQPADNLLREIMACYSELQQEEPFLMQMPGSGEIIGVFSPVGRCGKSLFALVLGRTLAAEFSTVYLTFEELSALGVWMGEDYPAGLSDLLYAGRRGGLTEAKIDSVLYSWEELHYIPPVTYPEDLMEVSGEEAVQLVRRITGMKGFERVVVDIGSCGRFRIPLMEACSVIYAPVPMDHVSARKMLLYENYLKVCGKADLAERLQTVMVPAGSGYSEKENSPDAALWGAAGDRVRMILKGGGTSWNGKW